MREGKAYKIIAKNFDTRCCVMVASYILDKGISYITEIPDEAIDKLEGNVIMTQRFVQELVRTARTICRECTQSEIVELIQDEWVLR